MTLAGRGGGRHAHVDVDLYGRYVNADDEHMKQMTLPLFDKTPHQFQQQHEEEEEQKQQQSKPPSLPQHQHRRQLRRLLIYRKRGRRTQQNNASILTNNTNSTNTGTSTNTHSNSTKYIDRDLYGRGDPRVFIDQDLHGRGGITSTDKQEDNSTHTAAAAATLLQSTKPSHENNVNVADMSKDKSKSMNGIKTRKSMFHILNAGGRFSINNINNNNYNNYNNNNNNNHHHVNNETSLKQENKSSNPAARSASLSEFYRSKSRRSRIQSMTARVRVNSKTQRKLDDLNNMESSTNMKIISVRSASALDTGHT